MTAPLASSRQPVELTEDLVAFHGTLPGILDGSKPLLTQAERLWLFVFRTVAARFKALTGDESFALSFDALCRCREKQKAGCWKYLRRACINQHLDFLGKHRRAEGPLPPNTAIEVGWEAVDARLDLEDALRTVARENRRWEQVVRMRHAGKTNAEIAAELGVSERQAVRITRQAGQRLRDLLGDYYGD
jgi:DNA-directed RNA polymerase specialized sigma24 family protein